MDAKKELKRIIESIFESMISIEGYASPSDVESAIKQGSSEIAQAILDAGFKKGKDDIFISHIKSHLKKGDVVICKICGKTAEEIIKEVKKCPKCGETELSIDGKHCLGCGYLRVKEGK